MRFVGRLNLSERGGATKPRDESSILAKDVNSPLSPRQRSQSPLRREDGGGRGQGEGGLRATRIKIPFDIKKIELGDAPGSRISPLTLPSPPAVKVSQAMTCSPAGGEGTVDVFRQNREVHPMSPGANAGTHPGLVRYP